MARTLHGNYTGRAASIQLREQREWIMEEQRKFRKELDWNFGDAMDQLRVLDPDGWSQWYDDLPVLNKEGLYPLILARVEELKSMNELIQLARNIRSTMHDSIQTVQMNKAEYALKMYADNLTRADEFRAKPFSTFGGWIGWFQGNADHFLREARIFLNTEYTG